MSEWQPIETAPRDGTEVLIGWFYVPYVGADKEWGILHAKWREKPFDGSHWSDHQHGIDWAPTDHELFWQPLPAPPALMSD